MGEYKIQKGDSWWKIANANGMTVDELKMLNPEIKMHPGQILQLKKSTLKPSLQSSLQSAASEKPGFFTIMGNKVSSWWDGISNSNKPTINVDAEIEEILKLPKVQREEVLREIMKKLGKESLGKWGADGNFGNTSKAAYRKFREEGYSYDFSKSNNTLNLNLAYVSLDGYKAFGVIPTGHAGIITRNSSGMYLYYDFGARHNSKSGLKKLNTETSTNSTDYRVVDLGKNLTQEQIGEKLGKYFPDNNSITFHWTTGDADKASNYMIERSKTNYNNYDMLSNNCSSEAECALEAAGVNFDGIIPSFDIPAYNTPENAQVYTWKRSINPEEQIQFENLLNQQLQERQLLYNQEYKGKTPDQIRQLALSKSRTNKSPNTNFMTAVDLTEEKRKTTTRNLTGSAHNCINTVTSFFNPSETVSSNLSFISTPWLYGFEEISEKEAEPSDVGILINTSGNPYHAVILDHLDNNGTWQVNYSNGTNIYKTNQNINNFKSPSQKLKLGQVKYYRYVGNKENIFNNVVKSIAPGIRYLSAIF